MGPFSILSVGRGGEDRAFAGLCWAPSKALEPLLLELTQLEATGDTEGHERKNFHVLGTLHLLELGGVGLAKAQRKYRKELPLVADLQGYCTFLMSSCGRSRSTSRITLDRAVVGRNLDPGCASRASGKGLDRCTRHLSMKLSSPHPSMSLVASKAHMDFQPFLPKRCT